MFEALHYVASSCVKGALMILIMLIAFGFMFGGKKGAMWVINTAIAPIKAAIQRKITAIIYVCVFTILSYYLGAKMISFFGF